jgi:hypothetical protein
VAVDDMQFELSHTFDADVDAVEQALFDPALPGFLLQEMKRVTAIEPLERHDDGNVIRRRVRYQPVPLIKKIGPKTVPEHWMAWIEESTYDRRTRRMEFANVPSTARIRDLLENRGTMTLSSVGPARTLRTLSGELHVKVFLLGKIAEGLIHAQGKEILDEEAHALQRFLDRARQVG